MHVNNLGEISGVQSAKSKNGTMMALVMCYSLQNRDQLNSVATKLSTSHQHDKLTMPTES